VRSSRIFARESTGSEFPSRPKPISIGRANAEIKQPIVAFLSPDAQALKKKSRGMSENLKECAIFKESGRQDLNLRPLRPETPKARSHLFRWALRICNCLQILTKEVHSLPTESQKLHRIRNFLLLGCYDEIAA